MINEHKFNFWVKGSWECYADSCFMFVLFMASYWPRDPHLLLALQQLSSLEGELNSSCRTQTLQLLFNSPIPLIGQSMVTLASDWLTLTRCLCRGCGHKVRYWLTSSLNSSISSICVSVYFCVHVWDGGQMGWCDYWHPLGASLDQGRGGF